MGTNELSKMLADAMSKVKNIRLGGLKQTDINEVF